MRPSVIAATNDPVLPAPRACGLTPHASATLAVNAAIRFGSMTALQGVSFEVARVPYSFVTRLPHAALV